MDKIISDSADLESFTRSGGKSKMEAILKQADWRNSFGRHDYGSSIYQAILAIHKKEALSSKEKNGVRQLHFDDKRALGEVTLHEKGSQAPWRRLGPGQGSMVVGGDKELTWGIGYYPGEALRGYDCQNLTPQMVDRISVRDLSRAEVGDLAPIIEKIKPLQLSFVNCDIDDESVQRMCSYEELRSVDLGSVSRPLPITEKSVIHLASLRKIEKISLSNVAITETAAQALGEMRNLKSLGLIRCTANPDCVARALNAKGLQNLALMEMDLPSPCMSKVPQLDGLQSLNVSRSRIDNGSMQYIAAVQTLESIDLRGTPLDDSGLKQLAVLQKLKRAVLSNTRITDASLSVIKGWQGLENLSIDGAGFSKQAVSQLLDLSRLSKLTVNSSQIDHEVRKHNVNGCSIIEIPLPPTLQGAASVGASQAAVGGCGCGSAQVTTATQPAAKPAGSSASSSGCGCGSPQPAAKPAESAASSGGCGCGSPQPAAKPAESSAGGGGCGCGSAQPAANPAPREAARQPAPRPGAIAQ